jgi:hypothetical protein
MKKVNIFERERERESVDTNMSAIKQNLICDSVSSENRFSKINTL